MTNDVYKEYMHNFNTTETQKLKDKINALKWEEIKEIEIKYQQMFEVLYTSRSIEVLTPEQIDINLIYKNSQKMSGHFLNPKKRNETKDKDLKHNEDERKKIFYQLSEPNFDIISNHRLKDIFNDLDTQKIIY